jgi:hypothetical protein
MTEGNSGLETEKPLAPSEGKVAVDGSHVRSDGDKPKVSL